MDTIRVVVSERNNIDDADRFSDARLAELGIPLSGVHWGTGFESSPISPGSDVEQVSRRVEDQASSTVPPRRETDQTYATAQDLLSESEKGKDKDNNARVGRNGSSVCVVM